MTLLEEHAFKANSTIIAAFGGRSSEAQHYLIDPNVYSLETYKKSPLGAHEFMQATYRRMLAAVEGALEFLETHDRGDQDEAVTAPSADVEAGTKTKTSNEVFLVHGRDSSAKTEAARLIERAGLKAIILHEQPNAGRTIIEKFENSRRSSRFRDRAADTGRCRRL